MHTFAIEEKRKRLNKRETLNLNVERIFQKDRA